MVRSERKEREEREEHAEHTGIVGRTTSNSSRGYALRIVALVMALATTLGMSPRPIPSGDPKEALARHDQYGELLGRYVRKGGVDYVSWVADQGDARALGNYVDELSALNPSDWPREDGMAYWINLYNAVTVHLVLENYPLESIKDIGGFLRKSPWKRHLVTVGERKLSLNDIENEIIRPTFQDPRIHFALNCASIGCPVLQPRPFLPSSLDDDLDSACDVAINGERWVRVTPKGVQLTKIFDWYKDDFTEIGVIAFINRYRVGNEIDPNARISYQDYDWSLNRIE